MRLIITFCFLISAFSFCNAQMTGVTIEVDTAFFGPNTPTPDDTFDPLGTLDGFVTYRVYAHFTNPTDVLSAIYALNDNFDVTIPLEIDAPCGCHNPVETSITMDANNSSLFWDSFPLMQYDTYWTIGMTSGDDIGMNPNNIGMPDGSEICSSSTIDGALYVLYPAPNAIAGSDLRILIAQVTTCGDLCIGANFQVFINGDQNQIQYFQPTSQTCVESSIVGCTSETACNFNPYAIDDDGSCDFTCCPGPGCCDEGTVWNEATQTCIVTNPTDTNFDGCTDLNDLMDLLSAYGDCAVPEIILGCMDDTALNFNPEATEDDGSCEYAPILTNYSMHFSGNTAQHSGTDYITMPNAIQYDLTGDFTIEFWIKFTSLAYSHIMGVNAFGSNSNGWLIKKPSDQMVLGWTYVPNEFGFYTVPSTNTWHHIAICFNDGTNTVKTFIDGNLHSTESRDININTSPFDLVIGREGTYSNYFQGYIDEVRLSNVSRYSIAFSPFTRHESDENTVGLWHFDEGEGSTASDSSSLENDGSITGADYSTDTPFTYAP